MRTTIELPDALFREVKAKAAREGTTLKEFFTRAAETELSGGETKGYRVKLPLIPASRVKSPVRSLTNAEIDAIFDEEDIARFQRVARARSKPARTPQTSHRMVR